MSVNTSSYDYSTSTVQQREAESSASGRQSIDFLTLLIAQLTNQDPLNPTEDTDFTSQLAQLEQLEQQIALNDTMTAMRTDTQVQSATSMIGKTVTGIDKAGNSVTGTVATVAQTSDGVYVVLGGGTQIAVGDVYNITGGESSIGSEISNSANAIGMWIEAGYDSAMQPVQGIIESVFVSDGTVMLQLYGGKSVSWDQVTNMRAPTDDEVWYTLPDELRAKVEAAQGMYGYAVNGANTDGEAVSGIVANAELNGGKVYLILMDGTYVDIDSVDGDPFIPTADIAIKALEGYTAAGLDENGNAVSGVVTGAEDREDGLVLLLDDGTEEGAYVYYDSLTSLAAPKAEEE